MARIFITGSADGLGQLAARALINLGHEVVLHARNAERGKQALDKATGAADILIADLSSVEETDKAVGNDSLRVIIPRALAFLYTIRNKRNIGHSGGDVEANQIDSLTIGKISDWVICELIRIFHDKSLEEAQRIVDFISSREIPVIWEVNGKKRVLKENSSAKEKVMLLTYSQEEQGVFFEDLISWVEYQNRTDFKSKVLIPLHREGMIEFLLMIA